MSDANLILIAGGLLIAGLLATVVAGRLRVPGLVLFIGLGMAIGSDGTGWIDFADYELARTIGVVALALILFEGGLSVGFGEIRPVLGASLALAIPGTLLTAAISGLAASWLFDLSLLEGMLLGAIVSATDGAAIFGVLRHSRLRHRIARVLEAEAGLNDPVAVLLVVGLIDWIQLRRLAGQAAQILTVRPWNDLDGDPAFPSRVLGTPVTEQLLSRLDRPGALVILEHGRYAFTGPILGVGPASALQDDARRRLVHASSDSERTWWREVIGALAR